MKKKALLYLVRLLMSFINANFAIYLALTQLANFFSITEDESMVMYNAEEFAIEIA